MTNPTDISALTGEFEALVAQHEAAQDDVAQALAEVNEWAATERQTLNERIAARRQEVRDEAGSLDSEQVARMKQLFTAIRTVCSVTETEMPESVVMPSGIRGGASDGRGQKNGASDATMAAIQSLSGNFNATSVHAALETDHTVQQVRSAMAGLAKANKIASVEGERGMYILADA